MIEKYYCKKDIIILTIIFWLFRLIEEFASDIYMGNAHIILILELVPIVLVIVLYSYRGYSCFYCWEFPVLYIINLIKPIFWMIIYNFYDGYAPHILKHYFSIDSLYLICVFILLLLSIRYKRYKNR